MATTPEHHRRRRRFLPLIWASSALAALVLALGVSGSLSGFTASITNSTNTVETGTLTMTETGISGVGSAGTCMSPDTTCALNKFGGQTTMVPDSATVYGGTTPDGVIPAGTDPDQNIGIVEFTNTGTSAASTLTLAGSACTGSNTNDLCSYLDVAVYASTTPPTSGTSSTYGTQVFYGKATSLAAFDAAVNSAPIASSGVEYLTFVVWIDGSATNTEQGETASEPLTWTFNS